MKFLEQLFFCRPRILNLLHQFKLANATSQTNAQELTALQRHASKANVAVEIGTYQGVSASRIAEAIAPRGILYCVDPWPDINGRPNPCWLICERHLRRTKAIEKIKVLRGYSAEVEMHLPEQFDFAFIDGDHSWQGIQTDWMIISRRLRSGGIACLHDTITPTSEPWRTPDSQRFYQEVVAFDPGFKLLEVVHSMTVLRRN